LSVPGVVHGAQNGVEARVVVAHRHDTPCGVIVCG
jgi:hypothetical protein